MAATQQLDSQNGSLPDEKLVGNYIAVHRLLEPMFQDMTAAELRRELTAPYLMVIYDELSTISRKYVTQEGWASLLKEWNDLEDKYGHLWQKPMILTGEEWGARKRALIAIRENLGMGTTAPTQSKSLHPPLRMAEFHRRCLKGCNIKKNLVESRQKWQ